MVKGFGQSKKDAIRVESMVASRTITPAVQISWGKNKTQLDMEQARHHAMAVLEAAAAAELDACLMQWAIQKLKLHPQEAGQILLLFRKKRESEQLPSVTINLGDEHIRPDTAKQQARFMLDIAFTTEIEAFLVSFLIQDLQQPGETADLLIQEFREMRGVTTLWPQEESGL
jgi:hypothetical protein